MITSTRPALQNSTTFARAVRRVKLPPPRLGPNVSVSTEAVKLEAVQFSAAPPTATAQPSIPDPPPATQPSAVRRVKAQPFPNVCEVDTQGLSEIEREVVRILSGRSASLGRIADQLSLLMSRVDVQALLDGLAAKGKVMAFIAEKQRTHYRLRSATEACAISAQILDKS